MHPSYVSRRPSECKLMQWVPASCKVRFLLRRPSRLLCKVPPCSTLRLLWDRATCRVQCRGFFCLSATCKSRIQLLCSSCRRSNGCRLPTESRCLRRASLSASRSLLSPHEFLIWIQLTMHLSHVSWRSSTSHLLS